MTTLQTTAPQSTIDRFASPEYTDPQARLPRIQALRGEKGDIDCGYFVTEAEMEKAGWRTYKVKDLMTYEYNSGGKERGLFVKESSDASGTKISYFCIRSPSLHAGKTHDRHRSLFQAAP